MRRQHNRALDLIAGLYAVTDELLIPEPGFVDRVAAALRGGARVIQYRDKSENREKRLRQAIGLMSVCREFAATLVINDDVQLAHQIGAPAVHLGQHDLNVRLARLHLGPEVLIGVTCHNSLELAISAQLAGADYVAFGTFHASPTKPDAVQATPDLLRNARKRLALPVVAIGGITPENGQFLVRAGAHAVAVVSGIFDQADAKAVEEAAKRYARLFG